MNQTPQPPPEPKPYGPGQCVDCGAAVAVPIVRCSRCAMKLSATMNRKVAVEELLLGGPLPGKERFSFSLQELFGLMTLIALVLGACIAFPLLGLIVCFVVLFALPRQYRLMRIADALDYNVPFRWKLRIFVSTAGTNFLIGAFTIAYATFVFFASTLGFGLVIAYVFKKIGSCTKFIDVFYVMAYVLLMLMSLLTMLFLVYLLVLLSKSISRYIAWRWQRDLQLIALFAMLENQTKEARNNDISSPFDEIIGSKQTE